MERGRGGGGEGSGGAHERRARAVAGEVVVIVPQAFSLPFGVLLGPRGRRRAAQQSFRGVVGDAAHVRADHNVDADGLRFVEPKDVLRDVLKDTVGEH